MRIDDESILQSQKTIEIDPNFGLAHNHLGQAYLQKQMTDEAIAELQKAVTAFRRQPDVHGQPRARLRGSRTRETKPKGSSAS